MPSVSFWLAYLAFGCAAGIIAGLLGVGGGIVVVPALYFLFTAQGLPHAHIMQMALGTSLATIVFTSVASFRAHDKRGAVRWDIFKSITPGILIGSFLGAWVAAQLSTKFLKGFFVAFLYYVSIQMILNIKPKPTRSIPGTAGMFATGGGVGLISNMVGIGGGTITVPFMTWCNIPIHVAVGTASAIGFPIAVAGVIGYIANGLGKADLPGMSIGYIYLPALIGIVATSMLTAKYGAKLAHALPVGTLKRVFALFLLAMATRMLWSMF
ncbi:sulfite exporter TauE/SafE family protein [Desulfovibrio sp. JY]|nr:sulfite exporter TauE/SafE family protein [Desulfovibrio sp. JY]